MTGWFSSVESDEDTMDGFEASVRSIDVDLMCLTDRIFESDPS
jgi:hypothetical protein